ncbi:redoxin family protein [Flagellimonas sp. CMM7]|uniref:redoxin family protein n=1 Tax=Flagellimonas sp. CMM7 TaxID=2654676 RepID=UPI0013D26855|nr:redoxin family protein [Flagellimonas sp. CMM7]UII80285.1 redoxin family protein [Flagellimonas sp. CMM7]
MRRIYLLAVVLLKITLLQAQTEPLKVGDPAPKVKVFKWLKGEPVTNLERGRVHVVEFGATWCAPCTAAIPHLSSLSDKYSKDVDVLSFFIKEFVREPKDPNNPEYVKKVERFVQRHDNKIKYKVAVDDVNRSMETSWHMAAGLRGVPYSFVIDRNGHIAWIGLSTKYNVIDEVVEYVTGPNYRLSEMVERNEKEKSKRQNFNKDELFLAEGNGGRSDNFDFRSIFRKSKAKYRVASPLYITSEGWFHENLASVNSMPGRIQFVNMQLVELYNAAYADTLENIPLQRNPITWEWWAESNPYRNRSYGEYWYHPIVEVSDTTALGSTNWRKRQTRSIENKYDYSVQVPMKKASAGFIQKVMQRDLQNYFDYDVKVEIREMPCWKLMATNTAKKMLATKTPGKSINIIYPEDGSFVFKNAIVKDIIWVLGLKYGFQQLDLYNLSVEDQAPFIDATGIDYEIDFEMSATNQEDFQGFRKYLESNGLKLEKSTKPMKVVVIKDPKGKTL